MDHDQPEDGRSPASQGRAATASPPSPAVSGIAGIPNAGGLSPFDPARDMIQEPLRSEICAADREFRSRASRLWGCLFQRHIPSYRERDAVAVAQSVCDAAEKLRDLTASAMSASGQDPKPASAARSEAKGDAH